MSDTASQFRGGYIIVREDNCLELQIEFRRLSRFPTDLQPAPLNLLLNKWAYSIYTVQEQYIVKNWGNVLFDTVNMHHMKAAQTICPRHT